MWCWYRMATPICFRLLVQAARWAASRAACTAGSSNAIKMPMMVMTTNNSTRPSPPANLFCETSAFLLVHDSALPCAVYSMAGRQPPYYHHPDRIRNSPLWGVGGDWWPVGSGQWAVGSGQSAVGSGQWAVGSRQSAVGSGQWAVGSGQSAVGSGQSAVGSRRGLATSAPPGFIDMLLGWQLYCHPRGDSATIAPTKPVISAPSGTSRWPLSTPHYPLPTIHSPLSTAQTIHLSTIHCRLPTAHCRLPTAHCRLPTAYCPLPTAHCPLPTAHCPLLQRPRAFAAAWSRSLTMKAWKSQPWLDQPEPSHVPAGRFSSAPSVCACQIGPVVGLVWAWMAEEAQCYAAPFISFPMLVGVFARPEIVAAARYGQYRTSADDRAVGRVGGCRGSRGAALLQLCFRRRSLFERQSGE